jgi:PAS domain S-box-containing protein/putative nucleotidyltransferase with HDIG domain
MDGQINSVLIVEDDAVSALVLRKALENRGYKVTAAANGEEALAILEREPFRIVISDWMMPCMDGLELCARIRKSAWSHYTYFILLTAKAQKEERAEGLRAGVDDYLLKPLDTAELDARLRVAGRILKMQEELYRLALVARKTTSGVLMTCRAGRVEWANAAFETILGRSLDEICGAQAEDLFISDETEPDTAAAIRAGFRGGSGINLEVLGRRKDGVACWLALDCAPILDRVGSVAQFVAIVSDITERKRNQEQIRRQFERITALRAIDIAINFGRDLGLTLAILLEQIPSHVGVDAAAILEFDPATKTMRYAAGRGFESVGACSRRIGLGEGRAGTVAQSQQPLNIASLVPSDDPTDVAFLERERFETYYGVPMTSRGELIGVLEVYHRRACVLDTDQQEFLATVAGQAAIAIANVRLLNELKHSNEELSNAYDSTIEGWSRALDLRDQETEGHSQRVTELTLRLARAMGFSEEELVHVRRGALLHDIGKMGIPDAVLLKPAPLCQEEWELMRRHPVYAHEMLSPINFLAPALDIPFCHHEKWDGSGYPNGLTGEEIPLSARLFAIVDVWDALRSDRPYRKAWPTDKACEHIRSLSGTHFDPQVVGAFLDMIDAADCCNEGLRRAA